MSNIEIKLDHRFGWWFKIRLNNGHTIAGRGYSKFSDARKDAESILKVLNKSESFS